MMKFSRMAALTLVLLPLTLSAQTNAVGDWKAVFVGPIDPRPKMFDEVRFSIQVTPGGFTGTARANNWPGDLDVSDVKLEGDRLTFTGTGKNGWSTQSFPGPRVDHCCPKLMFAGTIQGDEMKLTMTWQSTERPDDSDAPRLPMEAKRLSTEPGRR